MPIDYDIIFIYARFEELFSRVVRRVVITPDLEQMFRRIQRLRSNIEQRSEKQKKVRHCAPLNLSKPKFIGISKIDLKNKRSMPSRTKYIRRHHKQFQ